MQMVDGNFSATHRRRQEGSGVPSTIAKMYFREMNPNLSATPREKTDCSTNLVAASNVACRSKQNDISGIVCFFMADAPIGARIVFANTPLQRTAEENPNAAVIYFYDIACVVMPHLRVSSAELVMCCFPLSINPNVCNRNFIQELCPRSVSCQFCIHIATIKNAK